MEAKLKHLELIQNVTSRMAANSFALKGWSVVLVSALIALAAAKPNASLFIIGYFPALAFWLLDAYFLRQERLFRKLYDGVRILPPDQIDFSMDTSPYRREVQPMIRVAFSITLLIFHGVVVSVITVAAIFG